MARICIEATPSDDLERYELRLDDSDEDFIGPDGKGCVNRPDCQCGDGSVHRLYYGLFGPIGAKLEVKIFCDDAQIRDYEIEIFPPGGSMQGTAEFTL